MYRKLRFPILIGAGVLAAGLLLYHSNSRVDTRQTQGAIAQRDVYRDAEVKTADVGTPGEAPVATKAILESKEFQALAKNEAFQNLMADANFARLAQNAQFLSMLRNSAFHRKLQSESFRQTLQAGSSAELASQLRNLSANDLAQKQAKKSSENDSFARLASNAEFQAFWKAHADSHSLDLMRGSQFQALLARSDFQGALQRGMAAGLVSNLEPPNGLKQNAAPIDGLKQNAAPIDGLKSNAAPIDGLKQNAAPIDGRK